MAFGSNGPLGARRLGVVAAVFAVVAAVALAGCGGSNGKSKADGKFVAYIDGTCANSWRTTVRAEIEDEVKKHAEISRFQYRCAQGDLNKAVSDVKSFTAQGVDALVLFSDFGDALAPALKAARAKGVVVVPWLIDVGDPDAYDAQVMDNTEDLGNQIADYFIGKLNGKGNVVTVAGAAGNSFDAQIDKAMKARLEANGMKFLEEAPADWDPAKAGPATATLLAKYNQINAVFSSEATMIPPIIDQFKNAGRPLPEFASLDVNGVAGEVLDLMPSNPTVGWGFLSARTWGVRQALTTALDILDGKKPTDKTIFIENKISDCATQCASLYDADMPDTWIGTTKISKEVMKKLLG